MLRKISVILKNLVADVGKMEERIWNIEEKQNKKKTQDRKKKEKLTWEEKQGLGWEEKCMRWTNGELSWQWRPLRELSELASLLG